MEEDEAAEQFFDEVPNGFERTITFLAFEARKVDAEGLGELEFPMR